MLTGLGGNDTLNGGAGADTMFGGIGNDTYVVDNAGDVVNETGGDGTDTVQSSISFSLADAVHAIGSSREPDADRHGAINGTGNALDNVLTGNARHQCPDRRCRCRHAGRRRRHRHGELCGLCRGRQRQPGDGDRHLAAMRRATRLSSIENLTGSNFNDTLEGNGGNNKLAGGARHRHGVLCHTPLAGVTVNLAMTSGAEHDRRRNRHAVRLREPHRLGVQRYADRNRRQQRADRLAPATTR